MKVLIQGRWVDGWVDYYLGPREERLQVLACNNLSKLDELYFIRNKSLRLVWNYLKILGPREVLKKIISRRKEFSRNEKFMSVGIGRVVESKDEVRLGKVVGFLATSHPACCERIVISKALIFEFDEELSANDGIIYHNGADDERIDEELERLSGWSVYAGGFDPNLSKNTLQVFKSMGNEVPTSHIKGFPIKSSRISEIRESSTAKSDSRKSAVLFGYGNYAKTVVIPNIKKYVRVDRIHEVDPLQMDLKNTSVTWDSSPLWRSKKNCDVALIAGFHHTHAPLAIDALSNGIDVVIEKPIVVDSDQLVELLTTMENSDARLFSCFHKRYSGFNDYSLRDLGVTAGDPISYHCIVYEVPLPELHWYRWNNSGSRIVSNGCHWIDHFLYLNEFSTIDDTSLIEGRDGTINCTVSLDNGALFTMTLTDKGSERIGVQDYIELRAGTVTVKIINGTRYSSENSKRVLRRLRENRIRNYQNMYNTIGRLILTGGRGDTIESLKLSGETILELDRKIKNKFGK